MSKTKPVGMKADSVVEAVSERDRRWFERHPGATHYVRRRVPSEFTLFEGSETVETATHTLVIQVQPGFRTREPIILLTAPPGQKRTEDNFPTERVEVLSQLYGWGAFLAIGDHEVDVA